MAKFKDLKVGDKVRLDYLGKGKTLSVWDDMKQCKGLIGEVIDISTEFEHVRVSFSESSTDWWYKPKWLTKIEEDIVVDKTDTELVDEFYESVKESEWEDYLAGGKLECQLICVQDFIHGLAIEAGWWHDINTGKPITDNPLTFSNKLMLIVSECAEAMEGDRKDLMDDKLPHRKAAEVELADAVIRCFDLAGGFKFDLAGAIVEKLKYNTTRPDHTKASRLSSGGKAY